MEREGWRLADTWIPFSRGAFPAGRQGRGRLVAVTVHGPSRASFAERRGASGAALRLLAHTRLSGEVRLKAGYARVTVHASAASVLLVGALAGVFVLGGAHLFLTRPGLGTALVGAGSGAVGAWIGLQISRAGREVAADAVSTLEDLARGGGTAVPDP